MSIQFNFNLKKLAMIAAVGLACLMGSLMTRSCMSKQVSKYEQNIAAYEDSLRTYRLKDSSSVAAKRAFLVSQSELQAKLKAKGLEIEDLQKQLKSKVIATSQISSSIVIEKVEPIVMYDTILEDTGVRLASFNYNTENLSLDADVKVADSIDLTISNINIPVDLTVGQTKDNQIFVHTTNPYIKVNSIESYIPQQKKKHWGIGVNIGPGVYYDPFDKKARAGVGVQFGINYNF